MRNGQVSVAMDAGTIQGRHCLFVLLVNIRSDNSVVFYQLYPKISIAEEYSTTVCFILTDLETDDITLKAATVEWRSHAAAFSTKIPDCLEHRWSWVDTILDFIDQSGQSVKVGPNSNETFNIRRQLKLLF
ncbi:hypothetical protein BLNAU_17194 [Blattamonas nauphoetae]|uniref:Uncharacterized protein n=1 Tax=Blattamonas nauphoetae TaxID=2049346 RepID=A0ABQ9X7N6_9EUKA|nr:hypothetical protein BLNAU_17194 [Blattamonas nauphoetae]